MSVHFDTNNFPLVTITYGAQGSITNEDLAMVNVRLLGLLANNIPFVVLSDMTIGYPEPSQGAVLSDCVNKHRDLFRRLVRGNCIAVPSTPVRAMLRAALLVVKPPFPVGITATRLEAEKWCSQQMLQKSA